MTAAPASPRDHRRSWWLRLSVPIGLLGMAGAGIGAFVPGAYHGLTRDWANQTYAQDLTDLFVVFPLLLAFGVLARHGSPRALISWLGVLVATLYTYVIYAFTVPFGHLYLVNVGLLGLAGWSCGAALLAINPDAVMQQFDARAPTRSTAWVLIVTAVGFGGLWLAEDIPAVIHGIAPQSVTDAGLPSNPVHVLDQAFLLPACILSGIALLRRRAWGYLWAPVLMTTLATISVGVVVIMIVATRDGEHGLIPIASTIAIVGLAQAALAARFLRHLTGERSTCTPSSTATERP